MPVAGLQPPAEGRGRVVGVVVRDVAAQLVVDVPEPNRGVLPVPLRHGPGHPQGVVAEQRRRHRVRLPPALAEHRAVGELGEDLGVAAGQPRRRRRRGRRQCDADARLVQPVQHGVEPAEVVLALAGLEHRPGEDRDADEVDAGLLHELDVLELGGERPLLGVVVAAVGQPGHHREGGTGGGGGGSRGGRAVRHRDEVPLGGASVRCGCHEGGPPGPGGDGGDGELGGDGGSSGRWRAHTRASPGCGGSGRRTTTRPL